MSDKWTQQQAIDLCKKIESICTGFGCHVGLTGGCLYREGERKDCDIILYRIRQVERIDVDGLFAALEQIGVTKRDGFGWCYKARYNGKRIDFLLPEEHKGEYSPEDEASFQEAQL